MGIDWQRPEYKKNLPDWQLVDKVCDEVDLDDLLPTLNKLDLSPENKERNAFYKDRASWFGASQMTLAGLIGVAFDDAPDIELPKALEYLRSNCDGQGVDLQQQMQGAVDSVLRKARAGLFVTYPQQEGDTSRAEQVAGSVVATIHRIDAKRIINWWTVSRGAEVLLGGVVFWDTISEVDDFEVTETAVLRHLELEGGVFVDRTWSREGDSGEWEIIEEYHPKDGTGNPWRVIPFTFIGARTNTVEIDRPPMLSLARLNRDHYRNSADNEESVWYAGQAQPYIVPSEYSQAEDLIKAKDAGFYIGSRMLVYGQIGFAQADPNTGARQAMIDKVEAMKALGARFLMPGTVPKTAQQDASEMKVSHSILSLVVANVEDAYNAALRFCSQYMNTGEAEAYVTLSRGFMDPEVTPEMIDRIISLYDRSLIGPEDALPSLKRAKLVDEEKTPEEFAEEVDARGGLMPPVDGVANEQI